MRKFAAHSESLTHFQANGYIVIESFLSASELEALRQECGVIVEHAFEQLAAEGAVQPDWEASQRGCIFETLPGRPSSLLATDHNAYVKQRSQWPCSPAACSLLLGPKVAQLVTALFGSTAVGTHQCPKLFNDQYIVKPPASAKSSFAWHRDSDWCLQDTHDCSGYLSLWCALDDMTPGNGCLQVRLDAQAQDVRCLPVKAGSAVVMSDQLLHCSTANMSKHTRRAWMPQFSMKPILSHSDCHSVPVSFAVPLTAA